MTNPEYEITHAAIRYAIQCMHDGNWHALRSMGFGCKECEALSRLTMADLVALEQRIAGHALKIELNHTLFWVALSDIRRETTEVETRVALIKRDAPADMLRALYGIGDKEYTRLRRLHGMQTGVGRPAELNLNGILVLSDILIRYGEHPTPADWLAIAEESQLSMRTIWREFKRWRGPQSASRARESTLAT